MDTFGFGAVYRPLGSLLSARSDEKRGRAFHVNHKSGVERPSSDYVSAVTLRNRLAGELSYFGTDLSSTQLKCSFRKRFSGTEPLHFKASDTPRNSSEEYGFALDSIDHQLAALLPQKSSDEACSAFKPCGTALGSQEIASVIASWSSDTDDEGAFESEESTAAACQAFPSSPPHACTSQVADIEGTELRNQRTNVYAELRNDSRLVSILHLTDMDRSTFAAIAQSRERWLASGRESHIDSNFPPDIHCFNESLPV
jgi:hypothetical protein